MQPIDLTKTRLQLIGQGEKLATRPSALKVMTDVVRNEGVSALYAGLSASIMRQAVYGTARLGLHREFSQRMQKAQGGGTRCHANVWRLHLDAFVPLPAVHSIGASSTSFTLCLHAWGFACAGTLSAWKSVASSMASGAIASVVGNPFDLALVRMQADGLKPAAERRGYRNVFDALFRVTREEGVTRLWRGFQPTMLRAIAMNVGMMATYDQAKAAIVAVSLKRSRCRRRVAAVLC